MGVLFEYDIGIYPKKKVPSDLLKIQKDALELLEGIEGELGSNMATSKQFVDCCLEAQKRNGH